MSTNFEETRHMLIILLLLIVTIFLFLCRGILKAARRLMQESKNSSSIQKFYWLASDGWGKQSQVVAGVEDFAVGAITVELESKRISGKWQAYFFCTFSDFFDNLANISLPIFEGLFYTFLLNIAALEW